MQLAQAGGEAVASPVQAVTLAAASGTQVSMGDYMQALQSTINTFGILVTILTVIVGVLGVAFTVAGWLAQRKAIEEARLQRSEAMEEIRNAQQIHKSELELLRELGSTRIQQSITAVEQTIDHLVERRVRMVEDTFSKDIAARLNQHDRDYGAALLKIETVLYTYQSECTVIDAAGNSAFDFPRYNTLRHLLTRLLSGSRTDIAPTLERLHKEFAPSLGRSTADFLKQLVEEFMNSPRFRRTDTLLLAHQLVRSLDARLS